MSSQRAWKKSSYSGGGQNECVEVAAGAHVLVRDTKNRDGGTLTLPVEGWTAFVVAAKAGEFDI